MHELAHYAAAVLLGRAEGFSVIPKKEGYRYVLGSVKSKTRYRVLSSFIALAPLLWWLALLLTLRHVHFIGAGRGLSQIRFDVILEKLRSFALQDAFFLWLLIQMFWAGRLSFPDIKNVFRGLVSFSGLALAGAAAAAYYFLNRF